MKSKYPWSALMRRTVGSDLQEVDSGLEASFVADTADMMSRWGWESQFDVRCTQLRVCMQRAGWCLLARTRGGREH